MSKRLAFLEGLVAAGKADSFARYGLAMEYRTLGRKDDAKQAFEALRAADPTYVPMYLMAGQLWSETGDREVARAWVDQGIAAARAKHDAHALSEPEGLAAELA